MSGDKYVPMRPYTRKTALVTFACCTPHIKLSYIHFLSSCFALHYALGTDVQYVSLDLD